MKPFDSEMRVIKRYFTDTTRFEVEQKLNEEILRLVHKEGWQLLEWCTEVDSDGRPYIKVRFDKVYLDL